MVKKNEAELNVTDILETWETLNAAIKNATIEECNILLAAELKGRRRQMFVFRIHSRFNRVRAFQERQDLKTKLAPDN